MFVLPGSEKTLRMNVSILPRSRRRLQSTHTYPRCPLMPSFSSTNLKSFSLNCSFATGLRLSKLVYTRPMGREISVQISDRARGSREMKRKEGSGEARGAWPSRRRGSARSQARRRGAKRGKQERRTAILTTVSRKAGSKVPSQARCSL